MAEPILRVGDRSQSVWPPLWPPLWPPVWQAEDLVRAEKADKVELSIPNLSLDEAEGEEPPPPADDASYAAASELRAAHHSQASDGFRWPLLERRVHQARFPTDS